MANIQGNINANNAAIAQIQKQVLQGISGGYQQAYIPGTPGSAGSPGYAVDNSPAINAQYNQIVGDTQNVYGQAIADVNARNPVISAQTNADKAAQNAVAQNSMAEAQNTQNSQAADVAAFMQKLGLSPTANPAQTQRTTAVQSLLGKNARGNNDAWANFLGKTGDNAELRNSLAASSFQGQLGDRTAQINAARAKALANAITYVGGSGGTRGTKAQKTGLSPSQQEAVDKYKISILGSANSRAAAAQKAKTANPKAKSAATSGHSKH